MSKANRQTESKDPYPATTYRGDAGNFKIVVRLFDEDDAEQFPISSREAATWGSSAWKCQVSEQRPASPVGTTPRGPAQPTKV